MTQATSIVAALAIQASHYNAFRAWCQQCWSGCAHGFDLRRTTLDNAADALLIAAEASGWIRRGSLAPRNEQRINAWVDKIDSANTRNMKAFESYGGEVFGPECFHWEPDRESPSYCEFVAFVQLERCVFVPLTERWRQYAIETEKAELRAAHHVGASHHANWERDLAEKRKATAKRRALLMMNDHAYTRRSIKNGVGPAVNALAAVLPVVTNPVLAAQVRYAISRIDGWIGMVPHDEPAWDIGDVE